MGLLTLASELVSIAVVRESAPWHREPVLVKILTNSSAHNTMYLFSLHYTDTQGM